MFINVRDNLQLYTNCALPHKLFLEPSKNYRTTIFQTTSRSYFIVTIALGGGEKGGLLLLNLVINISKISDIITAKY